MSSRLAKVLADSRSVLAFRTEVSRVACNASDMGILRLRTSPQSIRLDMVYFAGRLGVSAEWTTARFFKS